MIDRALCIGINAYGDGADLAGCVNDARDWSAVLAERGAQVGTLLDGDAIGANIKEAMRELVGSLRRGQTGVITYSGHGTWVPDLDGDEADRRDEALCPVDLWDGGVITDDTLFEIFSARAYGARLIFVSDSCHSGTVHRLARPLTPGDSGRPDRQVRFLAPGAFLTAAEKARALATGAAVSGKSRTSALTLTGCRDFEYSYDAWFPTGDGGQRANGAFTRVALDALAELPEGARCRDWHAAIRRSLPSLDYPQTPLIQGTAEQRSWPVF